MTKEEFKRRWEKDEYGDGITFDEIAECAQKWGLYRTPKTHPIADVVSAVVRAANCKMEEI